MAAAALCASPLQAQTELRGTLHVLWGDPREPGVRPITALTLTTDAGAVEWLRVAPALLEPYGGALALHGRRVSVDVAPARPAAAPSAGTVLDVRRISIAPGPSLLRPAAEVRRGSAVQRPYLTLLCKFPDWDVGLEPVSYWETMTGMGQHGAGHYWLEASNGQIDMTGSAVSGWHTLPQPSTAYSLGGFQPNLTQLAADCAAAADSAVHFPSFAGINFQFNINIGCCAWASAGGLNRDGVFQVYQMTWIGGDWGMGTYAHEIGHTFGLPHSSGPYGATYDSHWDVMSASTFFTPPGTAHRWSTHTLAHQKDRLGVVPAARRFTAPAGRSTLMLERSASPAANANHLLAVIPIQGSTTRYYTLEARRRTGYDVALPAEGVLVVYHGTPSADPIVMDPDMNGEVNDQGAAFAPGETFHDRANGIRVAVDSLVGEAYAVTLDVSRWTSLSVAAAPRRHEITVGTDTAFTDSAVVVAAGPDSATAAWTAATFTPMMQLLTTGGTGPGVVRWRIQTGALGAGTWVSSVLVRSNAPATYITVYDTLVVLPRAQLAAGFTAARVHDTVAAGRTKDRGVGVLLSGPGADSARWTLSASSSRITIPQPAGQGSGYVTYVRGDSALAPGLYVDTLRLTFDSAPGGAILVDSLRVVSTPVVTISRAPGPGRVPQEGAAVLDSVFVTMTGDLAAAGQYYAYGENASWIQPVTFTNTGSGWLRFTRRGGTRSPGTYVGRLVVQPVLYDSGRAFVDDTLLVEARPPALIVAPNTRGDSVPFGTISLDSVFVTPEGAGTTGKRWRMSASNRLFPLNRGGSFMPGSGVGDGWLVYGRNLAGRLAGVYVDTITVAYDDVNLTATARVVDRLVLTSSDLVPVAIVSDSLRREARVGVAYADTLMSSGGAGSVSWSLTGGALPAGLNLAAATGVISGMPQAAGTFTFSAQAQDSVAQAAARAFAIVVRPAALAFGADSARPNATMGAVYTTTLTTSGGGGAIRFALVSGALPAGLALDSVSGAVSGIPEAAGQSAFAVRARSGGADPDSVTRTFGITVVEPLLVRGSVMTQLLSGSGLTADQRRYLDLLGNRNGRVDVGDVSVWRERNP